MKDFIVIFRRNFISPTVIAILILALMLLLLKERRDAVFISVVIILNTFLAIVQETRAQRTLKKLELMSAPHARRILSNGSVEEILYNKLVIDDKIKLLLGDEVPADGEIIDSYGLEIDESIFTGESAPIEKQGKAIAYAATVIVAGSATMRVTSVGLNTRVGYMTTALKRYTPQLTPLQRAIADAISWLTYGALGLAILISIIYYLSDESTVQILKTITSAAVTIIPNGLLLASTLLLAFGSIRLAQVKVLPQKIASIEAMALLKVLCVDKTGTLTSDKISFDSFELFDKSITIIPELVGIVAKETSSSSATGDAIVEGFPAPDNYKIVQILSFSSARKMSGVKVMYKEQLYSVVVGAPESIALFAPLSSDQKRRIEILAGEGKRVMLVAIFDDTNMSLKSIKEDSGQAVGIIVLSNELRKGVKNTVEYLQNNDVSIRVISGDSPDTVRYVAKFAGIIGYSKVMTGIELQNLNANDWDAAITNTVIFARVFPEQKEKIVETYKRLGYFTGMIGDGINDALALKKSDLGVAMYAGAVATRRIADIILLDNSFNSLPIGMRLGNRITQAIELIATLFFHKIIYEIVLLVSTLLFGLVYPFEPRHVSFMNIFLVTLPTIMWTLTIPLPRNRLSPRYFWRDTLLAVTPIAALSGFMVTITYTMLRILHPDDLQGVSTTTVIVATLLGIYFVFLVSRMFNIKDNREARLARLLYALTVIMVVILSFGIGFIRDFFYFTTPSWQNNWPLLVLLAGTVILQWRLAGIAGKRLRIAIRNQSK